jgi:hypothetical protein
MLPPAVIRLVAAKATASRRQLQLRLGVNAKLTWLEWKCKPVEQSRFCGGRLPVVCTVVSSIACPSAGLGHLGFAQPAELFAAWLPLWRSRGLGGQLVT